jgi:hypothetical protein
MKKTTVDEVHILGVALVSGSEGVTLLSIESTLNSWKLHDQVYAKHKKLCEYFVDWIGIMLWNEMWHVGH